MVKRTKARSLSFALLLAVFILVGFIAAVQIVLAQLNYAGARKEYNKLRQYAPTAPEADPVRHETAQPVSETKSKQIEELLAINPDYIGWLRIEGVDIDYPVVRGTDNEQYITTSFVGKENASSTIFMDAGCIDGFNSPFSVLYGHNMDDGSMFSNLIKYTDAGFLDENDTISVIAATGEVLSYSIIYTNITDVYDTAYGLIGKDQKAVGEYMTSIGIPQSMTGILALSTCTNGGNDDERLLVLAVSS